MLGTGLVHCTSAIPGSRFQLIFLLDMMIIIDLLSSLSDFDDILFGDLLLILHILLIFKIHTTANNSDSVQHVSGHLTYQLFMSYHSLFMFCYSI